MALTDNIVAYYKLDESSGNAADASGNGKTLTNNGTVAYNTGKINNGADLGTSNSSKYLSYGSSLALGGSFTYTAWVKLNTEIAGSPDYMFINDTKLNVSPYWYCGMSYQYNGGTRQLMYWIDRNTFSGPQILDVRTLGTSNWYFLAMTYNSSNGNFNGYTNGSNVGSGNQSLLNGATYNANAFGVGALNLQPTSTSQYASAIIDEVGVWSRELSSSEITQLYNSGNGLQYPFTVSTRNSNFFGFLMP